MEDGWGGAIICWSDKRSNTSFDIYAQQINIKGMLGDVTAIPDEFVATTTFAPLQKPSQPGKAIYFHPI